MAQEEANVLANRISKVLHDIDPMNTCCSCNEGMEDEYLPEAKEIVKQVASGIALREAVRETFDRRFWKGCLEEPTREHGLDVVVKALQSLREKGD